MSKASTDLLVRLQSSRLDRFLTKHKGPISRSELSCAPVLSDNKLHVLSCTARSGQLNEMYSYTAAGVSGAGLPSAKRLQVNQAANAKNNRLQSLLRNREDSESGHQVHLQYRRRDDLDELPRHRFIERARCRPQLQNYSYDSMYRLSGMTISGGGTLVERRQLTTRPTNCLRSTTALSKPAPITRWPVRPDAQIQRAPVNPDLHLPLRSQRRQTRLPCTTRSAAKP